MQLNSLSPEMTITKKLSDPREEKKNHLGLEEISQLSNSQQLPPAQRF